jgi:hypothetical protein
MSFVVFNWSPEPPAEIEWSNFAAGFGMEWKRSGREREVKGGDGQRAKREAAEEADTLVEIYHLLRKLCIILNLQS